MRQGSSSILTRPPEAEISEAGAMARTEALSRAARLRNRIGWLFVIALLLAQFGLWRQFVLREVAWAYPTNFDQLAYLEQSYQTYERILSHGLVTGLEEGMGLRFGHLPMNAAGATLHLQAAVLYLMMGASRLSALSLNFLYWAAFQLVLIATLRWLTARWDATFLGLGLLLTTITPFFATGGSLFDFRLDFIAFCLFGIFVCAVIRSGVFADWRWSALAGVVAALLGTFRFITLVYLLAIFITFGVFLLAQWAARWRDLPGQQMVQRRIRGMIVAGLIIAIFAGPVIWHHREAIRSYYGLHVSGEEKALRAQQSGTTTLWANLKFYPNSLVDDHAGYGFVILASLVLAMAVATAALRAARGVRSRPAIDSAAAVAFTVICLIIPYLVLTRDTAKSPIVAGIMVAPLVWLVLLAALWLFGSAGRIARPRIASRVMAAASVLAMLAATYLQFSQYSRHSPLGAHRAEVEKVDAMWDRMARDCQVLGWTSPAIASDALQEFLYHKILAILAYEKYGVLLNAGATVGNRLEIYDAKELYDRLALSDFAIVSRNTGPPTFEFPFDRQMREWHGDILKWCRQNMVELEHDDLGVPFDREITLFIRPAAGMQAAADGWITSEGLDLSALAVALRKFPIIELRGQADFSLLPRTPNVKATLHLADGRDVPLAATFERAGSNYTITITTHPADLPDSGIVHVHLSFDQHFVPKELGANADTRELVMKIPERASLHRAPAATQP